MKSFEKKALDFCIKNKHRVTKSRMNVLKIISLSTKPIKAYDILSELSKIVQNPKPPTVYRAIDFWRGINFIHKIESLNAYTICESGKLHKGTQFMICDDCGAVTESHLRNLPSVLKKTLQENMFEQKSWSIEITGVCRKCL